MVLINWPSKTNDTIQLPSSEQGVTGGGVGGGGVGSGGGICTGGEAVSTVTFYLINVHM